MRGMGKLGAAVLLSGLAGCVVAPPPVALPAPLVAVPGPAKTETAFQQDDTACRAAAAAPLPDANRPPDPRPAANAASTTQPGALSSPAILPSDAYLHCMAARNNPVVPLAPVQPAYSYYPAYPVYAGFDYAYPWLYGGDFVGFGFYGGCCGRWYGGGFRGGWGRGGFRR